MKADTEATLMRYSDSVPQLRRALAENLTDIQKLDKLTNQLLEISKLDSRHPISKEIVDIEEVIKLVMNSFNRKTKTSTINVDIQSTGYYILANEQSIRQLLTIVLDNAVKYSPSKGRVQVSVVKQSKHVLLTVRDNGIGIPKDDLPHIFERFYRSKNASTSKRKITGYGLGLPLAKDIVELYGGTIRIDSKENVSTTVTISLPLYKLDK
jgi:two-component system sensor histidine kinase VicK